MKGNLNQKRIHRKRRIRAKIQGLTSRPRICIFRSLKTFYVQAIDDEKGRTLLAVDSRSQKKQDVAAIEKLGEEFGKKLAELKVREAVFDRGGYRYHGKVKAFAEGVRKSGVKF